MTRILLVEAVDPPGSTLRIHEIFRTDIAPKEALKAAKEKHPGWVNRDCTWRVYDRTAEDVPLGESVLLEELCADDRLLALRDEILRFLEEALTTYNQVIHELRYQQADAFERERQILVLQAENCRDLIAGIKGETIAGSPALNRSVR